MVQQRFILVSVCWYLVIQTTSAYTSLPHGRIVAAAGIKSHVTTTAALPFTSPQNGSIPTSRRRRLDKKNIGFSVRNTVDKRAHVLTTRLSSSIVDVIDAATDEGGNVTSIEQPVNVNVSINTSLTGEHVNAVPIKQQRRLQRFRDMVQIPKFTRKSSLNANSADSEISAEQKQRELDTTILKTAVPSMINLAVVPLVNAVDTFWIGRMGDALALAGQAAANQVFFTVYFLVNYLPTITAPLVAKAVGSNDTDTAQRRVGESIFVSTILGGVGTLALTCFPTTGLSMILPSSCAPALAYAKPYLRIRTLSMIPALIGATGFAAFRGSMDTVTPLKVSLLIKYVRVRFV